jgi:hypothetical protein
MQVQTAQQLWVMYLQLPNTEKTAFLSKVKTTEANQEAEGKTEKVPISSLSKKRGARTAEEIDAEVKALREEWDRGF